jgi:DNA-binding CsgD family transcriptional regulator
MNTELSAAEIRSLEAVAEHDNSTTAAQARGVSPQTLKNELSSAYRKLGVRSRTGAFRRLGWLRPRANPMALHQGRMRRQPFAAR